MRLVGVLLVLLSLAGCVSAYEAERVEHCRYQSAVFCR